jgi:hypothetical protein
MTHVVSFKPDFSMPLTSYLFCLVLVLAYAVVVSCGNIPETSCGALLVKYTQIAEELDQIPPLLQHLTGLYQAAKQRSDEAQAELDIRLAKHKDCKTLVPDEEGFVPPDVCRLALDPEIKGYQVMVDDNQKLMSNMSPSMQAAEVHHAELSRDAQVLRSQLAAQSCPLDSKMSPAKHVASEPPTDL